MDAHLERLQEAMWLRIWEESYGQGGNDALAAQRAEIMTVESSDPEDTAESNSMFAMKCLWGAKWLDAGRVQIVVGHKYAAALMSSAVVENIAEDMIVPWKAFAIDVPDGLLAERDMTFQRITVGIYEGLPFGCALTLFGTRHPITETQGHLQINRAASDPGALFFATDDALFGVDESVRDRDVKERAMRLAIRLTTGVLYTMQHTDNFRMKEYAHKSPASHRGPPPHRVYFVGKPMQLDCRPAVHHYLSGHKSAPPSVQSIVRGHYKRQVIGVGRSGRKVIWIEPYWRGPEEAPILSRPYAIGGAQ